MTDEQLRALVDVEDVQQPSDEQPDVAIDPLPQPARKATRTKRKRPAPRKGK